MSIPRSDVPPDDDFGNTEILDLAGENPGNLVAVAHPRTALTPDGQRKNYRGNSVLIDRDCPEGKIYLFDTSKPFPGYGGAA